MTARRTTRRCALATAGLTALAGIAAASAGAAPEQLADADAQLVDLCRAYMAAEDNLSELTRRLTDRWGVRFPAEAEAEQDAAADRLVNLQWEVIELPALTPTGCAAKAAVIWATWGNLRLPDEDDEDYFVATLLRDVIAAVPESARIPHRPILPACTSS